MNRRGLFAFFALTPVMAVEAIAKSPEPSKPKIEGAPFDGQTVLTLTAQDKPKPLENKAIIKGQPITIMKQTLDTKSVSMAVGEDGDLWLRSKDGEWKRVMTES